MPLMTGKWKWDTGKKFTEWYSVHSNSTWSALEANVEIRVEKPVTNGLAKIRPSDLYCNFVSHSAQAHNRG